MRRAPLVAAALSAGLTASAASASEELQSRVDTLSAEAARIGRQLQARETEATQAERELAALTTDLARLAAQEAEARDALHRARARLRRLIGAFASLSRAPEPAILAHPDAPLAAARAAALMERIGPALIAEARGVESALGDLAALRAADRDRRAALEAAVSELAGLRADLEAELDERNRALKDARAQAGAAIEAENAARALSAARAFEAALNRTAPPEAPSARSFAKARGALTPPLSTAVLSAGFGKSPKNARPGAPRQGLWMRGEAHGAVRAPWPGKILFANPFRRLGNVIILEPETGYLIVLGGLETLSRTAGDEVRAGDVIGRLDGPPAQTEEFLIEITHPSADSAEIDADSAGGPDAAGGMLYMEIREDGRPTDPAPWLRTSEKVSGL